MATTAHRTSSRRGTPSKTIAKEGYVIGVDIGGSNLRVALVDREGKIVGKWAAATGSTSSPETVVKQIAEGVTHLSQETGVSRPSLLAIAAGAPGVTDRENGVVRATSYLGGWRDVPLRSLLESVLRLPAVIENDVKLAAVGEHWIGAARGVRDFVFLAIGTGIAAGIFVNGELLHGPEWAAGEVGYLIVPGTPEEAVTRSMPGSLESTIGGEGIRQNWSRSCDGQVSHNISATEIIQLAMMGNVTAQGVLEKSARILAYAVYNISVVLNSSLFILGGGVGSSEPLLATTRGILQGYTQPVRPRLAVSALGQEAQLVGAARLALDVAANQLSRRG
jgi:glucokinase